MPSDSWAARQPFALKLVYWLGLAAATYTFVFPICHWVFACGCRNLWNGAAIHCNIHQAHLKHCPLCELPSYAYYAVLIGIVAVQGAFVQGRLVRRGSWLWAALAFPVLLVSGSLVLGWYRGYWTQ
jgi:hypothetical protein